MTPVVVDASVALKWFFRSHEGETDVSAALDLLRAVGEGRIALFQPPHFVAEVAAVLAREAPASAAASLRDLMRIEMTIVDESAVYQRAVALAVRLRQHVFDTLYHAVAFGTRSVLVTADERYLRQARGIGNVRSIGQFAC